MRSFLTFVIGSFLCAAAIAQPQPACQATSPEHAVALVELYTSEGCNSCPPADAWLRKLPTSATASVPIVPIALHVDYWNSDEWRDKYSDHRFTLRQQFLASAVKSKLVYTPEVFVNGRELRDWDGSALQSISDRLNTQPAGASLTLVQYENRDGTYRIDANLNKVNGQHDKVAMQIAMYQNNLSSKPTGGENGGATLHHGYATRSMSDLIVAVDGKAEGSITGHLPDGANSADLGFIVFAQDLTSGEVLQALALPVCAAKL